MAIAVEKNAQITFRFGAYITHFDNFDTKIEMSNSNKFYYITDGECEFIIDNKAYKVKSGDLLFIPSGVMHHRHYINDNKKITLYFFHFDFLCAEKPNFFEELGLPFAVSIGYKHKVIQLFKTILKFSQSQQLEARFKVTANILNLMAFYIDVAAPSQKNIGEDRIVHNISKYIKENIDRQIAVAELSRIACMQKNYFIRYFKKETGCSPYQFIMKVKIDIAVGLLENTETTVGEVMEKIGFYDMSHFSNTFKKHVGCSPITYVKKFRNTANKSNGIILK